MADNAWIIPALPLASFFVILFLGKRMPGKGAYVGIAAIAASLVVAIGIVIQVVSHSGDTPFVRERAYDLVNFGAGHWTLGMKIDGLAAFMLLVVCTVSLLVQIYSTGYMHGDKRYTFFFAILSLFTTGMLIVTVADNLLLMLVGWEIMGVCSYFLIGHYWEEEPNSNAAIKAFLTTRVGDVGFMLGVITLYWGAGSFKFTDIIEKAEAHQITSGMIVAGTLLIFCGAIGKSAQFPLHTWLPDAMAGPTPVSALIHAATMVASGIYLVARLYPVFELSSAALNLMGVLAAITMVGAACMALVQDDIKKVLAYSTVSQLAYMTGALSVGGYTAGFFHLFTHAAFKGLLFLGAGSVIHAVGTNNMSEMGGLRKYMPRTHLTYLIGCLALAGFPLFAAFWSKDEILFDAWNAAHWGTAEEGVLTNPGVGKLVFVAAVVTALMTAFYTTRMYCLTFRGKYRGTAHPHESPLSITGPLMVLAVPAALAGFLNSPWTTTAHSNFGSWIRFGGAPHAAHLDPTMVVFSVVTGLTGIAVGYLVYGAGMPSRDPTLNMGFATTLFENRFYVDAFYLRAIVRPVRVQVAAASYWINQNILDAPPNLAAKGGVVAGELAYSFDQNAIDGVVNGSGRVASIFGRGLRLLQNGNVQAYATGMFAGVVALAVIFAAR
ncbi:MAG: NADH-quinone oxidoreductase subunit L [Actinomycetota bacterium]